MLESIRKVYNSLSRFEEIEISSLNIMKPVTDKVICNIEEKAGVKVPEKVKRFFTTEASSINFNWYTENDSLMGNYKYGELVILSPEEICEAYEFMIEQVEEAKKNEELLNNEGLQAIVNDYCYWIPLIRFSNGDYFCIETRSKDNNIVFLEHDVMDGGPNLHGLKIANCFEDLIEKWAKVGFVDVYDWYDVVNEDGIDIHNDKLSNIVKLMASL